MLLEGVRGSHAAHVLWFLGASVGLMHAEIAVAKPACDDLAGSVVFHDMLYGIGIGAGLTGLFMAAQDDFANAGQRVAIGGLGGAGIGLAVGALELGLRDCPASTDNRPIAGWQKPLVALAPTSQGSAAVVQLGYVFK
jgi:hypothetical protein